MMKLLLPVLLLLFGTGAGIGAGFFLRPAPPPQTAEADAHGSEDPHSPQKEDEDHKTTSHDSASHDAGDRDYVKLNNQFVIPVVEAGEVSSLVVMSLSVEIEPGYREDIFRREPKLRDSFLQVLFDHANVGGFRGAFTDNNTLDVLRASLRDVAIRDGGEHVTDVLILEIARQDY
jgi:hypothetical protein